uniref:Uncharacterized protein n=1 Tax=Mycena chlorophos TaxID=658473 RepID=A0ABQ0MBG0_MYCCL|nr:predicted protein [Mycena chlorophos]
MPNSICRGRAARTSELKIQDLSMSFPWALEKRWASAPCFRLPRSYPLLPLARSEIHVEERALTISRTVLTGELIWLETLEAIERPSWSEISDARDHKQPLHPPRFCAKQGEETQPEDLRNTPSVEMSFLLDSPRTTDSRSLSKYTSYSYDDREPLRRSMAKEKENVPLFDASAFSAEGFADFTLDLACLSPPSSPSNLPVAVDNDDGYMPASPPKSSRRSVSFSADPSTIVRPSSAPRLSFSGNGNGNGNGATAGVGSWTLGRYATVGRGTPIDRERRSQWVGDGDEDEDEGEANEQGVLFSGSRNGNGHTYPRTRRRSGSASGRATSQRSISPLAEWSYLPPPPPLKAHTFGGYGKPRSLSSLGQLEKDDRDRESSTKVVTTIPLPESKKIKLPGLHSEASAEWAESMRAAFASSAAAGPSKLVLSPTATELSTMPTPALTADLGTSVPRSPLSQSHGQDDVEEDGDDDDVPLASLSLPLTRFPSPPSTSAAHIANTTRSRSSTRTALNNQGIEALTAAVDHPVPAPQLPCENGDTTSVSASVYSCDSSPRERAGLTAGLAADSCIVLQNSETVSVKSGRSAGRMKLGTGRGLDAGWWRRLWNRMRKLRLGFGERSREKAKERGKGKERAVEIAGEETED